MRAVRIPRPAGRELSERRAFEFAQSARAERQASSAVREKRTQEAPHANRIRFPWSFDRSKSIAERLRVDELDRKPQAPLAICRPTLPLVGRKRRSPFGARAPSHSLSSFRGTS
jgi:hypothetical protein